MGTKAIVDNVKGTSDVLGNRYRLMRWIRSTLLSCFESHGYAGIDVPVLEHTDLFLRKSGSEVVAKMYAFTDQGGRQISMRPEFTASVIRAYVEHAQSLPLPVRWHYDGPVFRYERPQRSRSRQFTQQGVELIGGAAAGADAEVLLLACRCLEAVGLKNFRFAIGHVGVILQLLEHLQLSERVKAFLLSSLEDLSRRARGIESVRGRMLELGLMGIDGVDPELKATLSLLDERQARLVVRGLLSSMNVDLSGSREPEEIVERFIRKLRGSDEEERIGTALDFISRLGQIRGAPTDAFASARDLLQEFGLDPGSLETLRESVEVFVDNLGDDSKVVVDFGLARGLAYYTGMVFEVNHLDLPGDLQICGGGRYDGLVRALGCREDVPALGFSFGVERLVEAIAAEGVASPVGADGFVNVLVIAANSGIPGRASLLKVADALRKNGKVVEVDVRGRSLKANLDYANKRGISTVVIVPGDGDEAGVCIVKDMSTGEETNVTLSLA